jgi:LmbE family N-acetylglucosaminyl deacetylase
LYPLGQVLALGAHTDDIEMGCGGTLARIRRESPSTRITVVALSRAEASLPEGSALDRLEREFRASIAHLGDDVEVIVMDYPTRTLDEHRQSVLDDLISLRRRLEPDLVFTHSTLDTHQDHAVLSAETVRAFRGLSVLGYEAPWNQTVSIAPLRVALQPEDVDVKMAMVTEYQSQAQLGRIYVTPEFVRGFASYRGAQAKTAHAEAFELIYGTL